MMLVLDMDGTLFDTSARWYECEKLANGNKRMFWECYQSPRFMNLVKRVSVQFSETESKQIVASVLRFFATESKQISQTYVCMCIEWGHRVESKIRASSRIPLNHMFARTSSRKNRVATCR